MKKLTQPMLDKMVLDELGTEGTQGKLGAVKETLLNIARGKKAEAGE